MDRATTNWTGRIYTLVRIAFVVVTVLLFAGCPLPFDFNGEGSGDNISSDPSTPRITAPVEITYSVQGGDSGFVPDGGSTIATETTTVTLSTETDNAVIYFTVDGSPISSFESANRIDASSGGFTVTRTSAVESRSIHAIALGPGMLPSPMVSGTVTVSAFPILAVSAATGTISEEGGSTDFVVTATEAPATDITLNFTTGGTYDPAFVSINGGAGGPGSNFTATLASGTTSITVPIVASEDPNTQNETAILTLNDGTGYVVGTESFSVTVADNATPELSITSSAATISDAAGTMSFTVVSSDVASADLVVALETGGTYEVGDVTGSVSGPPATVAASGSTLLLTIPVGSTSVTFTIVAAPDFGEYDPETFSLILLGRPEYTVIAPSSQSVSITDSSVVPTLTIGATPTTISDVAGAATFTINASAPVEVDTTVSLRTGTAYQAGDISGDVPGPGTDFSAVINAGTASVDLDLTAVPDLGIVDADVVAVSVLPGVGYTGTPSASVTITDSTVIPTLSVTASPTAFDDDSPGTIVNVSASSTLEATTIVPLNLGGSFENGEVSFASNPVNPGGTFNLTLPAGSTGGGVLVTPSTDIGEFDDETVTVTIDPGSGAQYTVGGGPATVTIRDTSEMVISLNSATTSVTDSGLANVTVTTTEPNNAADTIVFIGTSGSFEDVDATFDGNQVNNGDVFLFILPAGNTSASFQVVGQPDTNDTADETITMTVLPAAGYTVGAPNSDTFTFIDSDPTVFYVSTTGSNAYHGTTPLLPFRTITHALTVAGPIALSTPGGSTVNVAPGTYDDAHGEAQFPTIPVSVSVVGEPGTRGASTLWSVATMEPLDDSTIRGFSLLFSNPLGLSVGQNFITVADNTIVNPSGTGVRAITQNIITIRNNHISGSRVGIEVVGTNDANPDIVVEENIVTANDEGVRINVAGADFGGGTAGSVGQNTFTCSSIADMFMRPSYEMTIPVFATNNLWDRSPPDIGTAPGPSADILNGTGPGVVFILDFSATAPGACP